MFPGYTRAQSLPPLSVDNPSYNGSSVPPSPSNEAHAVKPTLSRRMSSAAEYALPSDSRMVLKSRPRAGSTVVASSENDDNIAALYQLYQQSQKSKAENADGPRRQASSRAHSPQISAQHSPRSIKISRGDSPERKPTSSFYGNVYNQPAAAPRSESVLPTNALHSPRQSNVFVLENKEEKGSTYEPSVSTVLAKQKGLNKRMSAVEAEALQPDDDFPLLTRKMVKRLRNWAARARFNVAVKSGDDQDFVHGGLHYDFDVAGKNDLVSDFMVENHLQDTSGIDLMNGLGTSWFVINAAAQREQQVSFQPVDKSNSFQRMATRMKSPSGSGPRKSFVRNTMDNLSGKVLEGLGSGWETFKEVMIKYSFCVTGAVLLCIVAGIMYAANVVIETVEIGLIFLIAAGCFLAYAPAELVENGIFALLAFMSAKYRYLRHLEFLLLTLKTKIKLIIIGTGALLYINLGTNLFENATATLAMNVFITSVAIWAIFDILLQSMMHKWNVTAHLAKLNDLLLKETIIRHLCKIPYQEIKPDATPEEIKAWKTFDFHQLTDHSSFFSFNRRVKYVRDSEMLVPLKRVNTHAPRNNYLSYSFSEATWIKLTRANELELVAEILFNSIDKGNYGVITFVEWMEKFQTFRGAAFTWSAMFGSIRNNIRGVDLVCFKEMFTQIFLQRNDLTATLRDFDNISQVVKRMIQGAFWFFMVIVIMLVCGVSAQKVLVTLSTLLVTFAVGFGNSIKGTFDSIIFILYTKPYDVGDVVILGNADNPGLSVSGISIMTTRFVAGDNKIVIIPNTSLMSMPIYNLRKSKDAVVSMKFDISFQTSPEKLRILTDRLREFIVNHRYTRTKFDMFISNVDSMSTATLSIIFQTVYGWQSALAVVYIKSNMYLFIQEQIRLLEMEPLKRPIQPVEVAGQINYANPI